MLSARERASRFLDWADGLADGAEPIHKQFGDGQSSPITAVWYRDRPSAGWGSGLTYGASLLGHQHIELLVVVRSRDPIWLWAAADFVQRKRDEISQLWIGDTIDWHEPIARHSAMDAFVIAGPVSLPPDEGIVHLDADDHVQILQAVPAYASELALVREQGAGAWAQRVGPDVLNPRRPPLPEATPSCE